MGLVGRMSLGEIAIGLKRNTGRRIKQRNQKTRLKMAQWRDKARLNLLEARKALKLKVERNKELMRERKTASEKSSNPTAFPLEVTIARKPYLEFSTVPPKPRYSKVEPRTRLYGIRLELLDEGRLAKPIRRKA